MTTIQTLPETGPVTRAVPAAVGSQLRWPAASAALVAGLAHLPVTPEHLREVPYIGWLFLGLILACAVGATALLLRDTVAVWTAMVAICAAAIVAYLLSRGPGLPGMPDDVGDWANPLGVISLASEGLVVLLGGAVLAGRRVRTGAALDTREHG